MARWSARRSSASPSSKFAGMSADGRSPVDERARRLGGPRADLLYDPADSRRGHVESWFLQASDPHARRGVWLRWTVWASERAPRRAIAETWAVAFGASRGHVVAKASIPFERARFASGALGVEIDGCTLTPGSARGRVDSGGRAILYDLSLASAGPPLALLPADWMYARQWPWQKLVSPIPSARVSGTIEVGGERWAVAGWPATVGHNWGNRHADAYAWGACNAWDDATDVLVEGVSVRAYLGPFVAPVATIVCVREGGGAHPLTRRTTFAELTRSAATLSPRRWSFRARAAGLDVSGEMWADTDDLVGLFYPNPDGTMCHCLGTTLARAEVTLRPVGGAPRTLTSGRASFEIGTRDPDHGVRMYA
jgi:Tocopherol cyclase